MAVRGRGLRGAERKGGRVAVERVRECPPMVGSEGVSADDGGMEKFSKNLTNSEGVCYTLAREASSRGRVCAGVRESGMPEASASHPPPPPFFCFQSFYPPTPLVRLFPPLDTEGVCLGVERGSGVERGDESVRAGAGVGRGWGREGGGVRTGCGHPENPRADGVHKTAARCFQNGQMRFQRRGVAFPKPRFPFPKEGCGVIGGRQLVTGE